MDLPAVMSSLYVFKELTGHKVIKNKNVRHTVSQFVNNSTNCIDAGSRNELKNNWIILNLNSKFFS